MRGSMLEFEANPFFIFIKKHYCYDCKKLLIRKKSSVVVNSEDENAKDYDFNINQTFAVGDIKFIRYVFECPECGKVYTISEMKRLKI